MWLNIFIIRGSTVSATARKLGVIIWNMATKGTAYKNPENYLFLDQKIKPGIVKRIQKQIDKFALTNEDLKFVTLRNGIKRHHRIQIFSAN